MTKISGAIQEFAMQITLKINSFFLSIFFVTSIVCSTAMATENRLQFLTDDGKVIELQITNSKIQILNDKKTVLFDRKSKRLFLEMNSISVVSNKTFLIDSNQFFWAVIRKPSKNGNGSGYCGAGFEDFIVLFKIGAGKLQLIDKYLAQSCLLNISINLDDLKDLNGENGPIIFQEHTGDLQFQQDTIANEVLTSKKVRLSPAIDQLKLTSQDLK